MRLLRVLHLVGVAARCIRYVLRAVQLAGLLTGGVDGGLRQVAAVGTHVGDVAVLVQPLSGLHRALRGVAQLAAGLLLQRAGHERRVRLAGVRPGVDSPDGELGNRQTGLQVTRAGLVEQDDVEAGLERPGLLHKARAGRQARAVQRDQRGVQRPRRRRVGLLGRGENAVQVPVASLDEAHPGALALDHDPGGDGLHAARRQLWHHLLPQHGTDLVAVQPVQDPPGLLGVDQRGVELAGGVDSVLDRLRGDLVEHHPAYRHLGLECLKQVPGDRLALAVLIRRQEQLVGVLQQRLQLGDLLALVGADDIQRLEAVIDVHAQPGPRLALVAGRNVGGVPRQVADMADARLDDVAGAEEASDLLCFCGRLDDDQPPAAGRGGWALGRRLLRGGRGGGVDVGHRSPSSGRCVAQCARPVANRKNAADPAVASGQ